MIDSKKPGGSRIGFLTNQLVIEDKNRVQRAVENRMELIITAIKRFSGEQEPGLSQLQEPGMQRAMMQSTITAMPSRMRLGWLRKRLSIAAARATAAQAMPAAATLNGETPRNDGTP
jgi:hypothetical protein